MFRSLTVHVKTFIVKGRIRNIVPYVRVQKQRASVCSLCNDKINKKFFWQNGWNDSSILFILLLSSAVESLSVATGDVAAPLHMMSSMLVWSVTVRPLQVFALIVVPTLTDKHVYTHTHSLRLRKPAEGGRGRGPYVWCQQFYPIAIHSKAAGSSVITYRRVCEAEQ